MNAKRGEKDNPFVTSEFSARVLTLEDVYEQHAQNVCTACSCVSKLVYSAE